MKSWKRGGRQGKRGGGQVKVEQEFGVVVEEVSDVRSGARAFRTLLYNSNTLDLQRGEEDGKGRKAEATFERVPNGWLQRKAPEAPVNHTINLLASQVETRWEELVEMLMSRLECEGTVSKSGKCLSSCQGRDGGQDKHSCAEGDAPNTSKGVVSKKKNNVDDISSHAFNGTLTCLQPKIKSEESLRMDGKLARRDPCCQSVTVAEAGSSALARPVVKYDVNTATKPVAFVVPGCYSETA
eukprot:753287-Hanusia_phi.AAC.2